MAQETQKTYAGVINRNMETEAGQIDRTCDLEVKFKTPPDNETLLEFMKFSGIEIHKLDGCIQFPNGKVDFTFTRRQGAVEADKNLRKLKEEGHSMPVHRLYVNDKIVVHLSWVPIRMEDSVIANYMKNNYARVISIKHQINRWNIKNGNRMLLMEKKDLKEGPPIPSYIWINNARIAARHYGQIPTCARCNQAGHRAIQCTRDRQVPAQKLSRQRDHVRAPTLREEMRDDGRTQSTHTEGEKGNPPERNTPTTATPVIYHRPSHIEDEDIVSNEEREQLLELIEKAKNQSTPNNDKLPIDTNQRNARNDQEHESEIEGILPSISSSETSSGNQSEEEENHDETAHPEWHETSTREQRDSPESPTETETNEINSETPINTKRHRTSNDDEDHLPPRKASSLSIGPTVSCRCLKCNKPLEIPDDRTVIDCLFCKEEHTILSACCENNPNMIFTTTQIRMIKEIYCNTKKKAVITRCCQQLIHEEDDNRNECPLCGKHKGLKDHHLKN